MSLLRLVGLIAGVALLISCFAEPQAPLRVGTNLWAGYEPFYVAREQGFYDEKIRLKELTSATEVLRAFRQGQLEVAAITLDEVLRLNQRSKDLRILLVTNISDGADHIIVRPGIDSFADLKDQQVAVEDHGVSAFMLYQSLAENGLDLVDVKLLSATINQHSRLMQSGEADAVVTFDPVAHQLEQQGFERLYDSSQLPIKIVDVLVTRTAVLQSRRDELNQLIDGYWHGLEAMKNRPAEVYPGIASRLNMQSDDLNRIYANLIMHDKSAHRHFFQTQLKQSLQAQQQFMLTQGLLSQPQDTRALIADWDH